MTRSRCGTQSTKASNGPTATPIDAGDLLLSWAAGSGYFDDADPAAGTGTRYFSAASAAGGLAGTAFPELGDDGRSITLQYAAPYADWQTAFDVGLPAHVVAAKAGLSDEEDLVDLIKDAPKGNPGKPSVNSALKTVGDFWNNGFDTKSLPDDPALYLSSGPYIVRDIVPEVSMKLVRNRDYVWGTEPWLDEINVRFTGALPTAVDALRSGQADIISPQPSADTAKLFAGLADQGNTVEQYSQSGYDHLDLNFSGPFADEDVRKAFLKTVPRQAIVDAVVGDLLAGRQTAGFPGLPSRAAQVRRHRQEQRLGRLRQGGHRRRQGTARRQPRPRSGSCTTATTPTGPRHSP